MLLSFLLIALSLSLGSAKPYSYPTIPERRDIITHNDILNGICRPVTIIFARGTFEIGNVGLLVGPPFFEALEARLPPNSLAIQGVNYPASLEGYFEGGDPVGAEKMAGLVHMATHNNCNDTQIIVSGYSQGAQLVHRMAPLLPSNLKSAITGVALFGDPDDGDALPGIPTRKVDTICITGDLICDGLPIVDPDHLAYGLTVDDAADFIVRLLK